LRGQGANTLIAVCTIMAIRITASVHRYGRNKLMIRTRTKPHSLGLSLAGDSVVRSFRERILTQTAQTVSDTTPPV
jgi:hypothetical protein